MGWLIGVEVLGIPLGVQGGWHPFGPRVVWNGQEGVIGQGLKVLKGILKPIRKFSGKASKVLIISQFEELGPGIRFKGIWRMGWQMPSQNMG